MGAVGGLRTAKRVIDAPLEKLEDFGHQMAFYVRAFAWVWRVIVRYKKEVIRLLAEVSLGTGGLAVMGGSVAIVAFMTFFTGTEVGLQGYNALNQIGSAAFAGFVSAYFNTRELAPTSRRWRCRPRSAAASPPSSARCGSATRSTRWRSWACRRCRSW